MSWDFSTEEKILEQLNSLNNTRLAFAQKIKQQKIEIQSLQKKLDEAREVIETFLYVPSYNDDELISAKTDARQWLNNNKDS